MIAVDIPIERGKGIEGNLGKVFDCWCDVQDHRAVIRNGGEEFGHNLVFTIDKEGMVPAADQMLGGNALDVGKVHQHAICREILVMNHIACQRDFKHVAVAVQVTALSLVIRDAVTGIKLKAACDQHDDEWVCSQEQVNCAERGAEYTIEAMVTPVRSLSTANHDRDVAGLRYVYPVLSRRAGGISVGINLNPNNACNWACLYCQVPGLTRGGPPPIDLNQLQDELSGLLARVQSGEFQGAVEGGQPLLLQDVAFSGNGEPTMAPEFCDAVRVVRAVMDSHDLNALPLRLITNGSQMLEPGVQSGLQIMAEGPAEVWFKIDAIDPQRMQIINGVQMGRDMMLRRLQACAAAVPTWVQSCWCQLDGQPPAAQEIEAYLEVLLAVHAQIKGVLLYGMARASQQPGAERLSALPHEWFEALAVRIKSLGLAVRISH